MRVMRGAVDGGCRVLHPHAGVGVGFQRTRTLVRVWVFPLLVFYANYIFPESSKKKYKKSESKSGYDELMSLLLRRDDAGEDDEVAEDHRELTEMESLAQLRGCKDKIDQL